ncbi:MAG: Hint domain-containing protein [Gordonibacter sp.]
MDIDNKVSQALDTLAAAADWSRTSFGWAYPFTVGDAEAAALRTLYGGDEMLSTEFPLFTARLQAAIGRQPVKANSDKPMSFVLVRDIECTNNHISAVADISLNLVPERLMVSLVLRKNGEVIDQIHRVLSSVAATSIELQSTSSLADDDVVEALVVATWDTSGGIFATCMDRSESSVGALDSVAAIRMAHPVLRWPNSTPAPIIAGSPSFDLAWAVQPVQGHDRTDVCFLRSPQTSLIDYVYPEERPAGSPQPMSLDIRGEVILVPERTFAGFTSATIGLSAPTPQPGKAGGGVPYIVELDDKYFHDEGNTFSFAFPTEWGSMIEDSVQTGNRPYDIDIDINFNTDKGAARLSVTSKAPAQVPCSKPSPHYSSIPPIQLFWGCLEASMFVLMADGSQKQIDNIRVGDLVACETGHTVVSDIIRGRESEIIHLETEQGAGLRATRDHPIVTTEGLKCADEVVTGDTVMMAGGSREVIRFHYPKDDGYEVCNLLLEGDSQHFFANGFAVGDNNVQGQMQCKRGEVDALPIPQDVLAEIDRMRRILEGRES